MSHNHNHSSKPVVGGFKLSSNFNQLYTQRKQQAEEFIKDISQNRQNASKQKSRQKSQKKNTPAKGASHGSLFKFNTQSQSLVDEVPVEILKKRSQSRLESMQDSTEDPSKNKFSLLQNQSERKEHFVKERKQLLKKYNIDVNAMMSQQNPTPGLLAKNLQNKIQEEDPEGTVKPSELYNVSTKISDPFVTPTIFQTPLLPCFASQFTQNTDALASKTIKQGEGVWRIGKIKIKKNKAVLKIGEIQYESQLVNAEGKCVSVKEDFLYKLRNWNGIWVCQPQQENF